LALWGTFAGGGGPESEGPRNAKTPAKPGNSGTSQGSKAERLRSESNRRWRICNPLPDTDFPEENPDPGQVDPAVDPTAPADPGLAELAKIWSSLPRAFRAGILAMVRAAKG